MNKKTVLFFLVVLFVGPLCTIAQVLNKQKMLQKFDFWDNRDFEWYKENIPFFESPDVELDKTYYYRWELINKHMVYGSTESGYAFTEFIDRPWWSGAFGTISCAAGHQLNEIRWLKNKRYFEDFSKYWFFTPNSNPRNYSNWLTDAIWQGSKVYADTNFVLGLLPSMMENYERWEEEHYSSKEGLFSWDGMHDGMETNINSRQTKDWFSGAPGYRPTLNSYMWADAQAIKELSLLKGDPIVAEYYQKKADVIKSNFQSKCWDPKRLFFMHRYQNDENGGIKANTLTYETGKYSGNDHGREEIGFIPWSFNMVDPGYEEAWKYLMDTSYFYSDFGPYCVEKNDPLFKIAKRCCEWSGNSWPYATSQTIKGMSNLLRNYTQKYVDKNDLFKLLTVFSQSQRKDGQPYIAEACNPLTGSWSGHDVPYHSEHYFHSSFIDLVIADLIGLQPRNDDSVTVNPLIPESWDYFCLDDVNYHGNALSIIWDRDGKKYNKGVGFQVLLNGKTIAKSVKVGKITAFVPPHAVVAEKKRYNLAVNNVGDLYPRAIASFPGVLYPFMYLNDGQFWYHVFPPNRWSSLGSKEMGNQWCGIDFGNEKSIDEVKVYFVDDSTLIKKPLSYSLEYWNGTDWAKVKAAVLMPKEPQGRAANTISFPSLRTSKLRIVMIPQKGCAVGLSEFEAWSDVLDTNKKYTSITTNIASQSTALVKASYTSKSDEFDLKFINDDKIDRKQLWSSHRSKNKADTLTFDFQRVKSVHTAYLFFYQDEWEQKPPKSYVLQYFDDKKLTWEVVRNAQNNPEIPQGNTLNLSTFDEVRTSKFRIVMEHLRTGNYTAMSELELYGNN